MGEAPRETRRASGLFLDAIFLLPEKGQRRECFEECTEGKSRGRKPRTFGRERQPGVAVIFGLFSLDKICQVSHSLGLFFLLVKIEFYDFFKIFFYFYFRIRSKRPIHAGLRRFKKN